MRPTILRLSPIVLALSPLFAEAVGLGEIVLHSKIGEPVRAEVAIVGGNEGIDTACFTLARGRDSDLPVVSDARIKLARDGRGYRLLINGHHPVNEAVFMLSLRAGCGVELQRDFVLMPEPPLERATALAPANLPLALDSRPMPRPTAAGPTLQALPGDTLESIAAGLAPDNPARQQRMLKALKRANPEVDSEAPLEAGTVLRMPSPRRRAALPPSAMPVEASPPRPAKPRPAPSRDTPPPPASAAPKAEGPSGGDRLVLAAPPADLRPGQKATPPQGSREEVEERILKLETTLHLLNEEVAKLNQALALTAETVAAQQKLQAALANQKTAAPEAPKLALPPPQPTAAHGGGWLELLLSALGGGVIAALAAHLMARRKERQVAGEIPLAVAASHLGHGPSPLPPSAPPRPEPTFAPAPPARPPAPEVPPPAPIAPISVQPVFSDFSQVPTSDLEVAEEDHNAILELAELMLSFGRVRGAAETLATYIDEATPENIRPWLMLLDLYRRGNMRPEFETLAPRVAARFNAHVPAWEESPSPVAGLKSLEDYAHIVWRLVHTWGTQECLDYLYDLVKDTRTGQRNGFPLEVIEEIAFLMRILEDGYGLQRID